MSAKQDAIFEKFRTNQGEIEHYFDEQQFLEAVAPMGEALNDLIKVLYALNGKEPEACEIDQLPLKPINGQERFMYVKAHLKQFHAFKQLVGLYEEVEKMAAKQDLLASLQKNKD